MNKDQARARRDRLTARIKKEWGRLTDDEIRKAEGNLDELAATIREKYGDAQESIAAKLNQFMESDQEDDDDRSN